MGDGRGPGHPSARQPWPVHPTREPGLRFTERMVASARRASTDDGDLAPYEDAARQGEAASATLAFELALTTDDLRTEVADLSRPVSAFGTVSCRRSRLTP